MPPSDGLVGGHTKEGHDGKVTLRKVKKEATTRNPMVIESDRLPLPNCVSSSQAGQCATIGNAENGSLLLQEKR